MIPNNNDMRFEVTTRCNYRCLICPRERITRPMLTMSLVLFKKIFSRIINEAGQYNMLTFAGMGEPLLDRTLEEKILYARKLKNDLPVLILTNGSLLCPDRFRRLEDLGVASIRISFYGVDAVSYSSSHGINDNTMYGKVRDNILKILDIKTKTKILLTFNSVGNDTEQVKKWIDFWQGKADLVEAWTPHNWVDARKYRFIQPRKLSTCGRPFNGPLQVQADGTVNMCCFDFDGKLTLGDLKTQSLMEIFSSSVFRKIYKCHKSGNFQKSGLICEECDQRNKDKKDVMVYSSKFKAADRVRQLSTNYSDITKA